MKSVNVLNSLMVVFAGLQHYTGAVTVLRCVEARSPSLTLSCPGPTDQYMISIRSAYYARLPFNTPGFCEQPTPNSNRGDCVPHANVDRDVAASSCNTYNSCVLYPSYNDIVSSCSSVTGQVYAHVEFDCLSRMLYDGSLNDFIRIDTNIYTTVSGKMNIIPSSYPGTTTASSNRCQIRLPANADVVLKVLDLRGSSSATGCAYQLYMFSGISNKYREWCAKSQPASVWYSSVYFHSTTGGPAQIVDVVFNRIAASANGAVWIEAEARMKTGSAAQNVIVQCGSSVQLQPLPFTSSSTTTTTTTPTTTTTTTPTTTTTTPTTTTTTTTPRPTTTSTTTTSTTTTTPTTTTTTTTPRPTTTSTTTRSTTTTTPTTTTTTTTTPRPTTTSTTTTTTTTTTPTTTTTTTTTTTPTTTTTTTTTPRSTTTSTTTSAGMSTTPSTANPTTSSTTTPTSSQDVLFTIPLTTTNDSDSSGNSTLPATQRVKETSPVISSQLAIIVACCVGGGLLLLVLIIAADRMFFAPCRRQAKVRKLSTMLPDVIGTWKYDGNRGDPGGSGPHDGFGTGAHELQPVTTSATNSVYLVVSEENAMLPTEETTVITPVAPLPQVQSNARTSILVDPTSPTDRRNSKGQVRFVAPEDGTIQYPGRGTSFFDEDYARSRSLTNGRDRHPNSLGNRGSRPSRSPPPQRRKTAKPSSPPSLTSPRVTAIQANDTEAQQNPLYGASVDLFIY